MRTVIQATGTAISTDAPVTHVARSPVCQTSVRTRSLVAMSHTRSSPISDARSSR